MYKLSLNVYWSLMKNIGTHCLIFKACIYIENGVVKSSRKIYDCVTAVSFKTRTRKLDVALHSECTLQNLSST